MGNMQGGWPGNPFWNQAEYEEQQRQRFYALQMQSHQNIYSNSTAPPPAPEAGHETLLLLLEE